MYQFLMELCETVSDSVRIVVRGNEDPRGLEAFLVREMRMWGFVGCEIPGSKVPAVRPDKPRNASGKVEVLR